MGIESDKYNKPREIIDANEEPERFGEDLLQLADTYFQLVIEHTEQGPRLSELRDTVVMLREVEADPGIQVMFAAQSLVALSLANQGIDGSRQLDDAEVHGRLRQLTEVMPVAMAERLAVLRQHALELATLPADEIIELLSCEAYELLSLRQISDEQPDDVSEAMWWSRLRDRAIHRPEVPVVTREYETAELAENLGMHADVVTFLNRAWWHQFRMRRKAMGDAAGHMAHHHDWHLGVRRDEVVSFIGQEVRLAPEGVVAALAFLGHGLKIEDDAYQSIVTADPVVSLDRLRQVANDNDLTANQFPDIVSTAPSERLAREVAWLQGEFDQQPHHEQIDALSELDTSAAQWLSSLTDEEMETRSSLRTIHDTLAAYLQAVSHPNKDGTYSRVYTHRLRLLGISLPTPPAREDHSRKNKPS